MTTAVRLAALGLLATVAFSVAPSLAQTAPDGPQIRPPRTDLRRIFVPDDPAAPSATEKAGFPTLQQIHDFSTDIGARIDFAPGSAALSSEATAALDRQIGWLAQHPGPGVEIQGRANEGLAPADDVRLSRLRAEAVRRYYVDHGLEAARFRVVPIGHRRPYLVCTPLPCRRLWDVVTVALVGRR